MKQRSILPGTVYKETIFCINIIRVFDCDKQDRDAQRKKSIEIWYNYLTMQLMPISKFFEKNECHFARAGLIAKSVVYCMFGIMVFMAAFRLFGQSPSKTDKHGLFSFLGKQTGGNIMLVVIACGLICYCIWRFTQAFFDSQNKGKDAKGLAVRARYLFSGLTYSSLIVVIAKLVFTDSDDDSDSKQSIVSTLLSKPLGQWMVGIVAIIIASVGIYQVWYGFSEKYRKHVDKAVNEKFRKLLLSSGKIGYIARGLVWLIISWLFAKAAYYASSSQAGDTSKAFQFLDNASYGTFILAAIGAGLICYGLFNSVRARYETFN